jgi:pimeloyl-ACP methyl ester carboxylesterase
MSSWQLPHSYDFRGREVRYGQRGNGAPVVVLHGTPWSSFNLRHVIIELAKEFSVYYYDLVGYGSSSKEAGDVSLGIQDDLLADLLSHWQLDSPAIVGHDFGGATLLRAHLLRGCEFSKIILIDPVAVSPWGSPFFQHVRKHETAFSSVPDYIHEAIVRAYVQSAAYKPINEAVLKEIVQPWLGPKGKPAFYRQIAQSDSKYTDEVQSLYGRIRSPTLILWGREDIWIPKERGYELSKMIPGSRLELIPNAGHLVIEEKPKMLSEMIVRFLLSST